MADEEKGGKTRKKGKKTNSKKRRMYKPKKGREIERAREINARERREKVARVF
jgi:hypothetical protein